MTAELPPLDTTSFDQVLDAATRLFAEYGVSQVSTMRIAAEAAIEEAALHRIFPTKFEIAYAIALRVTEEFVSAQTALADAPGSTIERLSRLIRSHITMTWQHRAEEEIRGDLLPTLGGPYPDRHRAITRQMSSYQDRIRDLIAEGVRSGIFTANDIDFATVSLIDALNGIRNWYRPEGDLTIAQLGDVYVDLIIHHLLRAPR